MENKHDQVMSAYFKASKLMAGCHLPQLYIKLEYSLTNNIHIWPRSFFFFSRSRSAATSTSHKHDIMFGPVWFA